MFLAVTLFLKLRFAVTEAICPAASSWVEGAMRQEILLLLRFFLLFRLYSIHDVIICNLHCLAPLFVRKLTLSSPFGLLPWLSILVEILSLDLDTFISRIRDISSITLLRSFFVAGLNFCDTGVFHHFQVW